GTIDAYYDANMDLLSDSHASSLFGSDWPIYSSEKQAAPARIIGFEEKDSVLYGVAMNSIISRGSIIDKAHIERSILSPHVSVGHHSQVHNSILLDYTSVGKNCRIKNAIVDKGVKIPDGTEIGYDLKKDKKIFDVSESDIVVIAKNTKF
ncbi:MAG: glucose-1-phosphate adenylyltransferase, partial [bacterium]|nr:glucose-1-phosphate adenylyltransferase [bacterium]